MRTACRRSTSVKTSTSTTLSRWGRCDTGGHRWDSADADMNAAHEAVHYGGEPFTFIPTKPLYGDEPGASTPRESHVQRLAAIDRSPAPPLLLDRLDPLGPTILYGPGDIGKGTLASSWATRLQAAGRRVLILDYEDHPEEWARRIFGLGGADAVADIVHVPPLREWGGPLWKHADGVRKLAEAEGRDFVIIDSAAMAAAGIDPSSPEAPQLISSGLQEVGLPSLTLAHVNRAHDARYPFGSVFWHNLARVTWSFMPKGEERILVCRKANNYAKPGASTVTATWHMGVLGEVAERLAAWGLLDRIAEVLADGPAAPRDIATTLNEGVPDGEKTSRQTVAATLSRGLAKDRAFRFTVADGEWSLREDD